MEDWVRLDVIEAQHGIPAATLRRRLNGGDPELLGRQVPLRPGVSRLVWELHISSLVKMVQPKQADEYDRLYSRWLEDMATGYHSNKGLKAVTIDNYRYGMQSYWKYLGVSPSVAAITPENFRVCLANLMRMKEAERQKLIEKGQEVKKNCHFGIKHQIYKALRSFYSLLIAEKLKPIEDLEGLKRYKPTRGVPERRTYVYTDEIDKVLETNRNWLDGRGEFCILLTETILMLGFYGGFRSKEIRELRLPDLRLDAGVICVEGKGKRREVGIEPRLEKQLKKWLQYRPKVTTDHVLLQKDGTPLTKRVIARRVQAVAQKVGIDLTPHGLRRSAGGVWEEELGLTWSEMSEMYGHSSIEITKIYVPKNKRRAIEKLKAGIQKPESAKPPNVGVLPPLSY